VTRAAHAVLAALAALTLGASGPAGVIGPAALGVVPADEVLPAAKTVGEPVDRPVPIEPVVPVVPVVPVYVGDDGEIVDPDRLAAWLQVHDSPMAEYASDLVLAGVAYDVDPRLVVTIAMTESTAGRYQPAGSHNAWGWGGSSGLVRWRSWTESIHDFTARFSSRYDTDNLDQRMARTYCPPCADHWLSTVRSVYADI
jgi:hypothetical protein